MDGIYLVTDEAASLGRPLLEVVSEAARAGISCVQLREKNSDTRQFLNKALDLKHLLAGTGIPLIVNDRVDVALASGAEGVHLGQSDMPYTKARELMGSDAIIGLSVETWEDVENAQQTDVDYIGVSPVFSTPTKTDTKEPWGVEGLKKIKAFSRHPLVAIGGLDASNVGEIIAAGADSVAVVSAICSSADIFDSARQLVRIFENTHAVKEKSK